MSRLSTPTPVFRITITTIKENNMNLSKSYEFFKPESCGGRIHIIGCGAVGSTVAENLSRLG